MKFLLLTQVVLSALISFGYGIPNECKPENYEELTEQFRVLDYQSEKQTLKTDGKPLFVPGWYRFNVVAKRMLQRNELKESYGYFDSTKFQPCGAKREPFTYAFRAIQLGLLTSSFFVVEGDHPTVDYGLKITSAVGCKYRAVTSARENDLMTCDLRNIKNCTWNLECDNRNDRVNIVIRKCHGFYVYWLGPTPKQAFVPLTDLRINRPGSIPAALKDGLYCGTEESEPPISTVHSQCQQYRSYFDHTRQWNHLQQILPSPLCNDDSTPRMGFLHEKWTRFYNSTSDNTTMRLPENCPGYAEDYSQLKGGKFYCTAQYRGWLLGNHPSIYEGAVDRKLCFSEANTCQCQMSTVVSIINCGDFYIYRRRKKGFPHCFARACTVPEERNTAPITVPTVAPTKPEETSSKITTQKKPTESSSVTNSQMIPMRIMSSSMDSPMSTMRIMSSMSMQTNSLMGITPTKSKMTYLSTTEEITEMPVMSSILNSPMKIMANKSEMIYPHMLTTKMMISVSPVITMASKSFPMESNVELSPTKTFKVTEILPEKSMLASEPTVDIMEPQTTTTTTTTTKMPMIMEENRLDLCNNSYKTIIDDSRLASFSTLPTSGCDKHYYPAVRFVSSKGDDLQLIEGCRNTDQFTRACSSRSNVWLQGNHPESSYAEVKVMCMKTKQTESNPIDQAYCTCQDQQLILVQRCSNFYVYRLYPLFLTKNTYRSDCTFRYCTEKIPGAGPRTTTITTTTTIINPNDIKKEVFSLDGSLQILNPFVNNAPLRNEDIADKTSDTYQFLMEIIAKMLKKATKELIGITTIEILGFRIGSLITDYKMSGTEILSESSINETLTAYFTNNPSVDIATNRNSFSGMVNASSHKFTAVDHCSSQPCHQNATCANHVANSTFTCQCNAMYQGDGFTCDRLIEVKVLEEKVVNELSTLSIIVVAVVFGVCFLIIVILAFCLCCRSSHSYSTRGAFHRGGNLDNYYSTEAPSKDKTLTIPVAHNMYMTSEPSDGTTTFSEKYPMGSLDKQNSNFMK